MKLKIEVLLLLETNFIFVEIKNQNGDVFNINLDYKDDERTSCIETQFADNIEDAYNIRNDLVNKYKETNIVINKIDNSHIDQLSENKKYNETLSKKYSYVYIIRNALNGCLYVGSHTTDDLNDDYFGSGRDFNKVKERYGISSFEKNILYFTETHKWAKELENETIINLRNQNYELYNKTSAGFGGNYGEAVNKKIGKANKLNWQNNYDFMMSRSHSEEATLKKSESQKEWIANNPEEHKERMDKINKNPEKIRKTAEAHTGMKRTDSTKENIADARKNTYANATEEEYAAMSGLGMLYVTNVETWKMKRVESTYTLQENEEWGMKKNPLNPLKKRCVVTNLDTMEEYWVEAGHVLLSNEFKGNKKRAVSYKKSL